MSNMERTTSWQQIQLGVKEAERLIVRKEYNLVMVKARQVLEYMVRCMAERACVVEGDLSDTIDQLYEGQWINKATKDNYHTIRILGNKAVHEGDDAAYDANQAYQLLTQEVHAFSHDGGASGGGRTQRISSGGGRERTGQRGSQRPASAGNRAGGSRPVQGQRTQTGRSGYSSGQRNPNVRRRKRRGVSPLFYLWRLLIPLLVVILLIVVIQMIRPGKDEVKDTAAPTESSQTVESMPETEPETQPEAERYVVTGNSVNVRTEPSTSSRILVQLSQGTEVDYVKRYNNDWTVINYDGQEAYVSSQYIEKKASESEPSSEEDAESASGTDAAEVQAQ